MSFVNIISAIGNNRSVYPLILRDCGVEVPTKVAMTYNQNKKASEQMAINATRERLIDEYGTSLIWLGGIPVMNKLCNKVIKKFGYNPDINTKLFEETSAQGLKLNIQKFKNSASPEVLEMQKILQNKSKYQKLQAGKFILSTAIPVIIMGYALPKFNFALTEKRRKKQEALQPIFAPIMESEKQSQINFKGIVASMSNMSTVNKMAITDGGLAIGRVGTARNKFEAMENAFKMSMMMFLNFIAPIWIAKCLDKMSSALFNINVNLDPELINNKELLRKITNDTTKIPQSNIIEYFDKNPNSTITQLCEKYCGIKFLKNRVRDPRAYVDEAKVLKFLDELKKFAEQAKNSGNITKYSNKALRAKSVNILANVGISSFLLAVALPKITFILRKKITGSDAEPGLIKT